MYFSSTGTHEFTTRHYGKLTILVYAINNICGLPMFEELLEAIVTSYPCLELHFQNAHLHCHI